MSDDRNERLEEQWRRWARRPPATPADVAARRLVARLEKERAQRVLPRRWGVLAAAAAALLVVALAVPLAVREPVAPPSAVVERPPLKEGVVLIWLDSETPLYLTLASVKGDPP